jgi:hypothetical protein
MVPVCARPVSPVTTLHELSSRESHCRRLRSHLFTYILSRSIVGRPRHQGVMVGMGQKDSYVG